MAVVLRERPSRVKDRYWLFAHRQQGTYPPAGARSGKWLVFVSAGQVDQAWARIAEATEQGHLGATSKVATAKPNSNAMSQDIKVICVYTYDFEDQADVRRIREELRRLGITKQIPYKTDQDTLQGRYAVTGERGISRYHE